MLRYRESCGCLAELGVREDDDVYEDGVITFCDLHKTPKRRSLSTTHDCGCTVEEVWVNGFKRESWNILYCSKHAAAPELYEELESLCVKLYEALHGAEYAVYYMAKHGHDLDLIDWEERHEKVKAVLALYRNEKRTMNDQEKLLLLAGAMKNLMKALSETSIWDIDPDWDHEPWWPFVHSAEHAINQILDEVVDA